jgi:rhodanese-related sulfurtransferase
MGWDVAVLVAGPSDGDWDTGAHVPRVLGLDAVTASAIAVDDLREHLSAGKTLVVDLDLSTRYAKGHIPGAAFAIRARLATALKSLPAAEAIVLTSADGKLAALAASEAQASTSLPVMSLAGGTQAWAQAGLPLESGATNLADRPDDVYLMPRERGADREKAMQEYLTWEINLVNDMASDDDQRFRVVT